MGRSKRTPERSKLVLTETQAFSRRQRTGGDDSDDDDDPKAKRAQTAEPNESTQTELQPVSETEIKPLPESRDSVETQPLQMRPDPKDLPQIDPPDPRAEPWPDATPPPMRPVDAAEPPRQRAATMQAIPTVDIGRPPEMPRTTAPPPLVLGDVENPAHMPGPREIPGGSPGDPAPAPGSVPPGDSRSLRNATDEFALIYRIGTCVITRTGRVGTRGQWRVVEYPTSSAASSYYAKEVSRFVSEGFSDYRE